MASPKSTSATAAKNHPRLITIDESRKEELHKRLNRLAGQLEGIRRMIDEDRYCVDILNQTVSAQEALRGFSRAIMRRYLESCATNGLRSANPADAEKIYDEILDQLYKHAR